MTLISLRKGREQRAVLREGQKGGLRRGEENEGSRWTSTGDSGCSGSDRPSYPHDLNQFRALIALVANAVPERVLGIVVVVIQKLFALIRPYSIAIVVKLLLPLE